MKNLTLRLMNSWIMPVILLLAICCAGTGVSSATNAASTNRIETRSQSLLTNAPGIPVRPEPMISFGVVTDVQYADKPSEGKRQYRESLARLDKCIDQFNQDHLAFVMNLGDLIDGNGAASLDEFKRVVASFDRVQVPVHHVLGNHCLAVDRATALRILKIEPGYYAFQTNGWRFIVLNSMDVSVKSPTNSPEWIEAREYLAAHPRPPSWNGALGSRQLQWLKDTLTDTTKSGQKAIVFCHHPVLPAATEASLVLWNSKEVLKVLESSGCVVAYLCGHDHRGGYAEQNGIHHLTLPGLVEAPNGDNCCAVVEVFRDHLLIIGTGTMPGRDLKIRSQ